MRVQPETIGVPVTARVHGGDWNRIIQDLDLKDCPPLRLDFSVNLNPLGIPPAVEAFLHAGKVAWDKYPEPYADAAVKALAHAHSLPREQVLLGNGSTELFALALRVLKPARISWVDPCYCGYQEVCHALGMKGAPLGRTTEEDDFSLLGLATLPFNEVDLVFLASPNNPTGRILDPHGIREAALLHPRTWFVLDESYLDFLPEGQSPSAMGTEMPGNLMVIKSMTKFFSMPGLRLGLLAAAPSLVATLKRGMLPWSLNSAATAVAPLLYADLEFLRESRRFVHEWREFLVHGLAGLGALRVFPSSANFLYAKLPPHCPARKLQRELLQTGLLIRTYGEAHEPDGHFLRVAVRRPEENEELIQGIGKMLLGRKPFADPAPKKAAQAIMVLGTMSNSGKSTLAAALCRSIARNGGKVAPFKAQNMSLNSYVTPEGGEIGRAQAVQARAAGVEPHTDMNPVLLKPTGAGLMQVIVDGRTVGNFKAREYYDRKVDLRLLVQQAYDRLAARYDTIILEGAGSPAEINLRREDFVNASMAEYAGAACLLVADIDRGGVFASILGTVQLLPERHRKLLAGIVINKFRGDASLLDPGIEEIERLTGIPILGVLPYLEDLQWEEEDSLGLEGRGRGHPAMLDIAVIRLPYLSNYTDFHPLENLPGLSLRYVSKAGQLGNPDLILIPGTKNVRHDLDFLRRSGLEKTLVAATDRHIPLFGICGGYQMLGRNVKDPLGLEGEPGETPGLSLLPVETVLEREKELCRVEAGNLSLPFLPEGSACEGYEIHMGRTSIMGAAPALLQTLRKNNADCAEATGCVSPNGLVFGCYLHGIFDKQEVRRELLQWLARRKGLEWAGVETDNDRGNRAAFDRLADALESHVDLGRLFRQAGLPLLP